MIEFKIQKDRTMMDAHIYSNKIYIWKLCAILYRIEDYIEMSTNVALHEQWLKIKSGENMQRLLATVDEHDKN